jgi:phospholipid transport system substrate-binding protein
MLNSGSSVCAVVRESRVIKMMKSLLLCLALLLSLSGQGAPLAADELVRQEAAALFEAIDLHRSREDTELEAFYREVGARMDAFVDYDAIAQGVMGSYFAQATAAQRARFSRNFGEALLAFKFEAFEVQPPRVQPVATGERAAVVMTLRDENKKAYTVVYDMVRPGAEAPWRVRNVILDGVNFGRTYRNQFSSAMEARGPGALDEVIDAWLGEDTTEDDA